LPKGIKNSKRCVKSREDKQDGLNPAKCLEDEKTSHPPPLAIRKEYEDKE
jgi:hypothetical protein